MEDGNHPDEEAGLQVAHLGQVRKECQIANRDDIPIQLVKPLDGDELLTSGSRHMRRMKRQPA